MIKAVFLVFCLLALTLAEDAKPAEQYVACEGDVKGTTKEEGFRCVTDTEVCYVYVETKPEPEPVPPPTKEEVPPPPTKDEVPPKPAPSIDNTDPLPPKEENVKRVEDNVNQGSDAAVTGTVKCVPKDVIAPPPVDQCKPEVECSVRRLVDRAPADKTDGLDASTSQEADVESVFRCVDKDDVNLVCDCVGTASLQETAEGAVYEVVTGKYQCKPKDDPALCEIVTTKDTLCEVNVVACEAVVKDDAAQDVNRKCVCSSEGKLRCAEVATDYKLENTGDCVSASSATDAEKVCEKPVVVERVPPTEADLVKIVTAVVAAYADRVLQDSSNLLDLLKNTDLGVKEVVLSKGNDGTILVSAVGDAANEEKIKAAVAAALGNIGVTSDSIVQESYTSPVVSSAVSTAFAAVALAVALF